MNSIVANQPVKYTSERVKACYYKLISFVKVSTWNIKEDAGSVIRVGLIQRIIRCKCFDSRENIVAQELQTAILHALVIVL